MRKTIIQRVVYLVLALSLVAGMTTKMNLLQNFEARKDARPAIAPTEGVYYLAPREVPYGCVLYWCPVNE